VFILNTTNLKVIAVQKEHTPVTIAKIYEINGFSLGENAYIIAKIGSTAKGTPYFVDNQTARKYKVYGHKRGGMECMWFKWNDIRFFLNKIEFY
jgi:hypothetical protein